MSTIGNLCILAIFIINGCLFEEETLIKSFIVDKNVTVELSCPYQSNSTPVQWRGPPHLTAFSDGTHMKMSLPNYQRLKITGNFPNGDSNLQVANFTESDEGLYRCITMVNNITVHSDFKVVIYKQPTNMTVVNMTTTGKITALEGQPISLKCIVKSGKPAEMMTWISDDTLLKSGGPGNLLYTFIPTKSDHLKYFTCNARNRENYKPMRLRIQLYVSFVPTVEISGDDTLRISEGQHLSVNCSADTNVQKNTFTWMLNNKNLDSTLSFSNVSTSVNQSTLTIHHVKREDTGLLQCRVENTAGNGTDMIFIHVAYKPVIISPNTSDLHFDTEMGKPAYISLKIQSFQTPETGWISSRGGKLGTWITKRCHNQTSDAISIFVVSSTILPYKHAHFGNYSIRIRNDEGRTDLNITLIYTDWHVYIFPPTLTINTSDTLRLYCLLNTKKYTSWVFKVKHYRNNMFIRRLETKIEKDAANFSLSYIDYTDSGEYVCCLETDDAVFTASALVTIKGSPIIMNKSIIRIQNDIVFLLSVYSIPPPTKIEWFRNIGGMDKRMDLNSSVFKHTLSNTSMMVSIYGVVVSENGLQIKLAMPSMIGKQNDLYICQIRNIYGLAEATFYVHNASLYTTDITKNPRIFNNTIKSINKGERFIERHFLYGCLGVLSIVTLSLSVYIILRRRRENARVLQDRLQIDSEQLTNPYHYHSETVELQRISQISSSSYEEVQSIDVVNSSARMSSNSSLESLIEINHQHISKYEPLTSLPSDNHSYDVIETNDIPINLKIFPRLTKSQGDLKRQCLYIESDNSNWRKNVAKSF